MHASKIVAPWYQWPSVQVGRHSAPALQMYDTPDLVNAFLRDPTDSLDLSADGNDAPSLLTNQQVRKVFLGCHERHYLVVCELRCDVATFPSASRARVCAASFVVRRRAQLSGALVAELQRAAQAGHDRGKELAARIREFRPSRARGAAPALQARDAFLKEQTKLRRSQLLRGGADDSWVQEKTALLEPDALSEPRFNVVEQGWHGEPGGRGEWLPTPERPEELFELSYPLYPLIPDPRDPNHPARGKSIYFGLLPTGGREVDERDRPRYDDRSEYVVRCMFREKQPECADAAACGTPMWSAPSEVYRLAGFFDSQGHSHRAVSIPMPDLSDLMSLKADDAPWKKQAAGLRVESRERDMNLPLTSTADLSITEEEERGPGVPGAVILGGATCVYPIPLLMIVATFVFKIFSLILSLVFFPLSFLLSLRICFPTGSLPVRGPAPARTRPANPNAAEIALR